MQLSNIWYFSFLSYFIVYFVTHLNDTHFNLEALREMIFLKCQKDTLKSAKFTLFVLWLHSFGYFTPMFNPLSASRDNWCTVGGDGRCRVGEVRAGTTSPMPDHKSFKLQ